MSGSRFQAIHEVEIPAPQSVVNDAVTKANAHAIVLALKALSQRALTAITDLFTLCLVGSAWWLWNRVLADPTVLQLVGVSSYAVFCLLIDIARRRK